MRELKGDWRDLFNGFMVALDLRKCFLALLGIFVSICLCGGLTIVVGNSIDKIAVEPPPPGVLVLHKWWATQCQAWDVIFDGAYQRGPDGAPLFGVDGFPQRVKTGWAVRAGYSAAFILILLTIWSYFGGAISRIAAYEIAKDGERIETRKALQFARKKFWSFFWAPLICVIGFCFFAFCNYAGAFVAKLLDYLVIGAPLAAVFLPLVLLSGFIMTLIGLGTLSGLPLFAPAVAAEGTDSFDAVSRGFSYVYSRPWHYLWYQGVSGAYGYVCSAFVILFAITMCHLGIKASEEGFRLCGLMERPKEEKAEFRNIANSSWAMILSKDHVDCRMYPWDPVSLVAAPHPYGRLQVIANKIVGVDYADTEVPRTPHRVAGFIVTLWLAVTLGLSLGYVVSFFFSQQTLIYYILRKKVDGIEMNEVFEEDAPPAPDASKPPAGVTPAADAPPAPKPEEKK
jgi:hypothetical protein